MSSDLAPRINREHLLDIARDMERSLDPKSPALNLPKWVERIPGLNSRPARNFTRVAAWIIFSTYTLALVNFGDGTLTQPGPATALILFAISILSGFGIATDVPSVKTGIFLAGRIALISIFILISVLAVLLIALASVSNSTEEVLSILPSLTSLALMLHVTNSNEWGYSSRGRRWRSGYARASWATIMTLTLTSALALLLYSVRQIPSGTRAETPGVAVIGLIVTLFALVLGLLSRVLARQRRYLVLLRQALVDTEVAVKCHEKDRMLYETTYALDACLATGVDTGARIFSTAYESEQVRAVLMAFIERVGDSIEFTSSDLIVDARGRLAAKNWDVDTARVHLLIFLSDRRVGLSAGIDVAA